jgi:hypothetical protein
LRFFGNISKIFVTHLLTDKGVPSGTHEAYILLHKTNIVLRPRLNNANLIPTIKCKLAHVSSDGHKVERLSCKKLLRLSTVIMLHIISSYCSNKISSSRTNSNNDGGGGGGGGRCMLVFL